MGATLALRRDGRQPEKPAATEPREPAPDAFRNCGEQLQSLLSAGTFEQHYEKGAFIKRGAQGSVSFCSKVQAAGKRDGRRPKKTKRKRTRAAAAAQERNGTHVVKEMRKNWGSVPAIRNEVQFMRRLQAMKGYADVQEHFMRLEDVFETDTHVLVVLEKVEGLDLDVDSPGYWGSASAERKKEHGLRFLHQVMYAVKFLHERDATHGDLHACNIAISGPIEHGDTVAKLIDFGQAKILPPGTYEEWLTTLRTDTTLGYRDPGFDSDRHRLADGVNEMFEKGLAPHEFKNPAVKQLVGLLHSRRNNMSMHEVLEACVRGFGRAPDDEEKERATDGAEVALGLFSHIDPNDRNVEYAVEGPQGGFQAGYRGHHGRHAGSHYEEEEEEPYARGSRLGRRRWSERGGRRRLEELEEEQEELLGANARLRAKLRRVAGLVQDAKRVAGKFDE